MFLLPMLLGCPSTESPDEKSTNDTPMSYFSDPSFGAKTRVEKDGSVLFDYLEPDCENESANCNNYFGGSFKLNPGYSYSNFKSILCVWKTESIRSLQCLPPTDHNMGLFEGLTAHHGWWED